MNIAKNMEAIFIAAVVTLCAASYAPENLVSSNVEVSASNLAVVADRQADNQVQTVVIVGKRA